MKTLHNRIYAYTFIYVEQNLKNISWKSRYKTKDENTTWNMNSPQLWQKNSRCVAQNPIVKSLYLSSFLVLSSCNREKKVGLSSNLAPVMECLLWAYKMSHIWQFDHSWLVHTAVFSGPVQERVTLCNEWQNEIAVSWVHCVHLSSGRFGCIINAGWFFQSLQGCVTLWTKPLPTSVQSLLYNIHTYRGSPPYAHFRTWKKPCYIKFVLVGL